MSNKILLTGGHAGSTALATIKAIQKARRATQEIYWVGAASAHTGINTGKTFEEREFGKHDINYLKIHAGKIPRKITFYALINSLLLPVGFFEALWLIAKIRPNVIVSFGGYAAFPVVVIGYLMQIPIVIQEQTVVAGLTNRITARLASKIAIGRPQSMDFFPKSKTVLTGLPLSEDITSLGPKPKIGKPPVLLVTGGSRGARPINQVIGKALTEILKKFKVIHLTGEIDFSRVEGFKDTLSEDLARRYEVHAHVAPDEMKELYKKSDIIISRAGANSAAEILSVGRPAIIIPLPITWFDEQRKNAQLAENAGIAEVIEQKDLNKHTLLTTLNKILKNWDAMTKNYDRSWAKLDKNAANNVAEIVLSYL